MARPFDLVTRSAVPAELLLLARGALRQDDVDEGGALEFHRLVEGLLDVFRLLDEGAEAAEGLHHLVVARPPNQSIRLQVEHRVRRDFRHAGTDAAVVQDDDLDR